MEISKVLFHTNCWTVIVNGAVLLNVQIMAPANTKDLSKQGCNDGDRWKMANALGRQQQPLESLNMTAPSSVC